MVREAATLDAMPLFGRKNESKPATQPAARPAAVRERDDEDLDWRAYDEVGPEYLRVLAPRMALPARDLVDLLEPAPGWQVLDVGTGTGVVARELASRDGVRVVGIDIALGMLGQAHREDGGPSFAAAAAIDLPFRDSTFNGVTAAFVLSHFAKYDTALFDMLRVLRRDGHMGVTAWGPGGDEFLAAWTEVAEEFAETEILRDARQRAMPWDERFSDPNRLKDALYEAGLRHLRVERREYRFEMTAEDYLTGREIAATGRFLRTMLGEELWQRFRARARDVFADRFPPRFHDFRDVNLAVGTKLD
jgi:ubiquinone/menaquinone biosynthesis C-methylase UbiE